MVEKRTMRISEDWYNFIEKFQINRIKKGTDKKIKNLCDLPDIIVRYFKENNDRYLELVEMEEQNGNN